MRACDHCGGSMEGKRLNAVYCSRGCKTKASDQRRKDDGRAVTRDRARYPQEAERRRAEAREYLRRHPEKMRAVRRNRKSRIKAKRFLILESEWRRMVARYRHCCAYCGSYSEVLHREHVIPIIRGGRDSIGNSLPACPPCNFRKKAKLLSEWRYCAKGGVPHPIP